VSRDRESVVERVRQLGVNSSGLVDLCAVGFSRREEDAEQGMDMGRSISQRIPGVMSTSDLAYDLLRDVCGLEGFEALRSTALIEIGRRSAIASEGEVKEINDPEDVFKLLKHLQKEKREHFYAVLLTSANKVMRAAEIHIGTLTMSIVGPREIFREAVREGASSIIVAHNHPSGDPTPSPEDIAVTKQLVDAGILLDIPVLDHVIIGREYRSLSEMGLM